ncbi:hypothetical protein J3E72DRAFT_192606 [Bipolaris maydis]|nr:hypothetical protein J3E72DRAFT_192606 [Bipolaris maydis]KAJ6282183.1 hypothetical protein J3E71DRAFT_239761 [Bipolaris maydis]
MQSVSLSNRVLSPLRDPPVILFRTECHDRNSAAYNSTFRNFNIVSRGPHILLTREAFDNCLSWKKVNTPLIPFTKSWKRAIRRRQRLLEDGNKEIVIIAIWAKGLQNVYDASEVAKMLRCSNDGGNRCNHDDEYLIHGGISADDYRLLAVFDGQKEQRLGLNLPGLIGSTTVPDGFISTAPGTTGNEKLQNTIYMYTGIRGESAQLWYLIGFMIGAFDLPCISFVIG